MNFSTDRDLLLIDPHVFRDVPMMSQQRLKVTDASLTATTLTSPTADFQAAQIDTGCVVLLQDTDTPVEVVATTNATTLEVSLPRQDPNAAAIPPSLSTPSTDLTVVARTFAPQAAVVHAMLLRLAGIDEDDNPQELTADAIVSRSVMAHLEALGTLELVYAAAATINGENKQVAAKAERFRQRFNQAVREAAILVDLNGDGLADDQRRFGIINLQRV